MRALPRSIRMLSPIVDFVVTFENEEVQDRVIEIIFTLIYTILHALLYLIIHCPYFFSILSSFFILLFSWFLTIFYALFISDHSYFFHLIFHLTLSGHICHSMLYCVDPYLFLHLATKLNYLSIYSSTYPFKYQLHTSQLFTNSFIH